MGRALFSTRYGANAPAASADVDPAPAVPAAPAKWSVSAPFDPDADAFFESENAVDEHFLDLPTAPGSVRVNAIWDRLAGAADDAPVHAAVAESGDVVPIHTEASVAVSVPVHPLRTSTTAQDLTRTRTPSPQLAPLTIPVTVAPSPPSPASASVSPSTPPATHAPLALMTPSPAPTVSPRIYLWGRNAQASPGSPSPSIRYTHAAAYSHSASPRQSMPSFARITTRRRAQNV